jgi:hypothetical protein
MLCVAGALERASHSRLNKKGRPGGKAPPFSSFNAVATCR